jgi:AraC-like DNA-binding protein
MLQPLKLQLMKHYLACPVILGMLSFAELAGLNKEKLCADAGLEIRALGSSKRHVPLEKASLLWEIIEQKTGDSFVGLHMGEYNNLFTLGLTGMLVKNSSDLNTALEKACEYANLLGNVQLMRIEKETQLARIYFEVNRLCELKFERAIRHIVNSSMVFTLQEVQFLCLKRAEPLRVSFRHREQDAGEYRRIFSCPLDFGQEKNYLEFDAEILKRKILYDDYELLMTLEKVASRRMAELEKENQFADHVKKIVLSQMNPRFPALSEVSAILNLSPRTLQRRLSAQGTNYVKILESLRKELAIIYLQKDISVSEVSFLLGYAEPSIFVNAFKRWFGVTPGRFDAG